MSPLARLPALDGLRALAVLSVLAGHLISSPSVRQFVGGGDMGVMLFFCLSGFLITRILLQSRDTPQRFSRFYLRRAFRIFPIYYLVLGVAVLAGCEPVITHFGRLATYTLGIPGFPTPGLGPASHLWSLSVEEQFYWFWPVFVFLAPRSFLVRGTIAMIACSVLAKLVLLALGMGYSTLFRPLYGCLDSLGLGALVALWQQDKHPILSQVTHHSVGFCVAVMLALAWARICLDFDAWYEGYLVFGTLQFLVYAICFTVVIIHVTQHESPLRVILSHPGFEPIARISYGLYLYHFFCPGIVRWLSIQWLLAGHKFPVSQPVYAKLFVLGTIALSFVLAWLSWHCIEAPLLRYKDKLSKPSPLASGQP